MNNSNKPPYPPATKTNAFLLRVIAGLLFVILSCNIGQTQGATDQSLIQTQTALQVQQTKQAKDSSQDLQATNQALQGTQVAQIAQGTLLAQQGTQNAQQATHLAQPLIPTIQVTKPPTPEPLPTKKPWVPLPPPSGSSNTGSSKITLKVSNNTNGQAICYLYAAPSSSTNWGNDFLGANTTIQPGYWVSFTITPNAYDLRADDCDGNTLATKYNVAMYNSYTWTLTGGSAASYCGDGVCGNDEICPDDCGSGALTYCGDEVCGGSENASNCPSDCVTSYCGDGTCGPYDENALNCPDDCGYCGDGVCGNDEQCAEDCGSGGLGGYCGDGTCDVDENAGTCNEDCDYCGDGSCDSAAGEDADTCPVDCYN